MPWLESAAWVVAPEVSFSIYGERGIIDIVAWATVDPVRC